MNLARTYEGNKVPKFTRWFYPWSTLFRDMCYTLVGTFLLQYTYTSGVLSSDLATYQTQMHIITIAMMICLIWDGLNDPIMGFIVEKFHFKLGKFRPWILIGAIGNAVAVILLFTVRLEWTDGWGYVAAMIVFYVLWDTFFTMNDIGYWSMLPSLTNDPKERAKLTANVSIAASIGTVLMNVICFIGPSSFGVGAAEAYKIIAISASILFLVSQTVVFFFCQERKRDVVQEDVSSKSHFLDLFKVVWRNKQLLAVVIGLALYYFASFILTGIGQNYFYMVFGYASGGYVAVAVSAFYILGTVLAQVFYPMLAKHFKKQSLLTATFAVITLGYIAFFFLAFPLFGDHPLAYSTPLASDASGAADGSNLLSFLFGGALWLAYIPAIFFFAASGLYYLVILVMFQDAIDYNEWKYGERKESICFAWRPLDVKVASGLNIGLRNLVFLATGTMSFINVISNMEGLKNGYAFGADGKSEYTVDGVTNTFNGFLEQARSQITSNQLVLFGIIVIVVIVLAYTASYLCLHFGFKVDEKMEEKIVKELEERHALHEKEAKTESLETIEAAEGTK